MPEDSLPIHHAQNARQADGGMYSAIPMDEQPKPPKSSASKIPLFSPSTWLWEVLSLVLSVVVFVLLVVVLMMYNGKPNPLWTAGITLNAIVSIASVLFRILLMIPVANCVTQLAWVWLSDAQRPLDHIVLFDQASRGAFRSIIILFSSAYRYA